jgi:hypothetical protein
MPQKSLSVLVVVEKCVNVGVREKPEERLEYFLAASPGDEPEMDECNSHAWGAKSLVCRDLNVNAEIVDLSTGAEVAQVFWLMALLSDKRLARTCGAVTVEREWIIGVCDWIARIPFGAELVD